MATEAKTQYPTVPDAHWWALRKKFQQSIPGVVTANYLASVLNMQEESARANILPGLRLCGIIDSDGKPTERAKKWRDDTQYPAVCDAILASAYPAELLDAVPDPSKDRNAAARWFANATGGGEASVKKQVRFYALLCEKDPSQAAGERVTASEKPKKAAGASVRVAKKVEVPTNPPKAEAAKDLRGASRVEGPAVHINLQIHISADASPEQIEQVFKSLATHVYKDARA